MEDWHCRLKAILIRRWGSHHIDMVHQASNQIFIRRIVSMVQYWSKKHRLMVQIPFYIYKNFIWLEEVMITILNI